MNTTGDPEDGSQPGERASRRSTDRRTFLSTVSTGAVGLSAGCLGDYVDYSPPENPYAEGAWVTGFPGYLEEFDPANPNTTIGRFAYDVGFVVDPRSGDLTYVLAEDVEETESSVTITLKPDLEWSNGDPLTAEDFGRWLYMRRMGSSSSIPVPEIRDGSSRPRTAWDAITDVRWDDRTITVDGVFDRAASPLYGLNTHLGSKPRAHFDRVWEAFQNAYDEEPWEDDETWETVTRLVDDNSWYPTEAYRPEDGILLHDDDSSGQEAAFSGLWYPTRLERNHLYFERNEGHPFADRVSFDRLVWKYHGERANMIAALHNGDVDGISISDATENVVESAPPSFDSFEGPGRQIAAITLNHQDRFLRERDVRAALFRAIDRDELIDAIDLVTRRPIRVPGADLQVERWMPTELREQMRSYEYDLERARSLLENVGFEYDDEWWRTPDGDVFGFELMTSSSEASLEYSVVDQWRSFGIDVNIHSLEATSYQSHRDNRTFRAGYQTWSSPNSAGRRRTRAGEYVRTITAGDRFQDSAFLQREVDAAVDAHDDFRWVEREDTSYGMYDVRALEYDDVEALREITIDAPPFGEPAGELQEWPYLYHAVSVERAHELDEKVDHAQKCTWIYNYVVPELELVVEVPRLFHDTEQWSVPANDDSVWQTVGDELHPGSLWAALALGRIDRA